MTLLLEVLQRTLIVALVLSAVPLFVVMATGLCVSILQTVTQIQDQALSFVPKVAALFATLFVARHWFLENLLSCFQLVYSALARVS